MLVEFKSQSWNTIIDSWQSVEYIIMHEKELIGWYPWIDLSWACRVDSPIGPTS